MQDKLKEGYSSDLKDIKVVFDKYKTKFFLLYGTALGVYRDGDFLPGDDDIDLGSFDSKFREEIKRDLTSMGFEIGECYNIETKETIPSKMILAIRNTQTDIYFFEPWEGGFIAHRDGFSDPFIFFPRAYNKFQKVKFLGEVFLLPAPIEKYLTYFYGDWKDKNNKKHGKLFKDIYG